jgi:competence protein ComGF
MKKILLSIIILLSIAAFAYPQKKKLKKQKDTITQIEYETFSRRGRTEVTITKDSAISIGRTERKFIVITTAKWNQLLKSVQALKLSTIPLLKAPTKKREYDGAAHCKITVSTKANKYESQYFDSGKPMKSLQALYDGIDKIRNTIDSDGEAYTE